jgi:hypothetical protein
MFDATAGQMCAVLNNGDRTKWKDASQPTDAEARAIWDQTVSYCGAWTVDATRGELVYELGVNMFTIEPRQTFRVGGEQVRQDLDRDLAAERRVRRPIHLSHAAFADRRCDVVDAKARAWDKGHCVA